VGFIKPAVRQLHSKGIYPSEAAISHLLAKPGCFSAKEVRIALKAVRREIGLKSEDWRPSLEA
jgi:hypothetical protein